MMTLEQRRKVKGDKTAFIGQPSSVVRKAELSRKNKVNVTFFELTSKEFYA